MPKPVLNTEEAGQSDADEQSEILGALALRARNALAERARSGALVYFAVVMLLAISTDYYAAHGPLVLGTAVVMLITGVLRIVSAQRVLGGTPEQAATAAHMLRASTYATSAFWGLFNATTLLLYPGQWASTFLLLSTAALASGMTSSLAPDFKFATRNLWVVIVPTVVAAVSRGETAYLAFAAAATLYLAYLIVQTRQHSAMFRELCIAGEHEKRLNSAERRRIEAERATLAAAIEQAAEEIVITDASGTIQYCNKAFEQVTGYTRQEVIGQTPKILNSGKHDRKFYEHLWQTIKNGKVWSGRFTNRRKDGTLYEAEGNIAPIYDASGKLSGFVAARHDVTRRLQLEAQLRQAQKLESIGRLAGGVAHDFNNLLTVILGYSRVLLQEHPAENDSGRQYLQEITSAGERAASLTRQLLSFSRKQILMPRPVALNELVQEMRPMLERLVGEDIHIDVPSCPARLLVQADPDQMSQILMNLCGNARDAMPNGGTLTIQVSEGAPDSVPGAPSRLIEGPTVQLSVRDTGLGMDEETRQKLFEPFFTTKDHGQGTGLGLATVYGIVQQSEGYIEVLSEPGRGAEFRVYLPLLKDSVPRPAATPQGVQAPADRGNETILVVEDQEDLRQLVATVLKAQGYRVLDAEDGGSALRLAESTAETIDLLLTDVIMPDITGRDVADRIAKSRPQTRVLFMSGYSGDVIARRGVLEEDISYLQKPFTVNALTAKVREVLDASG